MSPSEADGFATAERVIVLVDLTGYAKVFQRHDDRAMAAFTQAFYGAAADAVAAQGGTVIKFMGDACLATFPADGAEAALRAVDAVADAVARLVAALGIAVGTSANVHKAEVVEGEFGTGALRRPDILGRGVNQTFILGSGPGVRISAAVYAALPESARARWRKADGAEVWVLASGPDGGAMRGLGKEAKANVERW